jgi:hypothetical protein
MNPAPELLAEVPFEHDGWPFVIRSFKTAEGLTVQSFLGNMPVSHTYAIDTATYNAQGSSGEDALSTLIDLARRDLAAGLYRRWILHWASQ